MWLVVRELNLNKLIFIFFLKFLPVKRKTFFLFKFLILSIFKIFLELPLVDNSTKM